MNILLVNENKEKLSKSDFTTSEYKFVTGKHDITSLLPTLSKVNIDFLVIDETAVEEMADSHTWIELTKVVDPGRIYVFLNAESMDNFILICTLINIGIYNFSNSVETLNHLLKSPNSLDDVADYRDILSSRNTRRHADEDSTKDANQKLREYVQKHNIKKKNTNYNFKLFELFNGFITYPLITIVLSTLYYCTLNYYPKLAAKVPGLNEGLSFKIVGDLTPAFLLFILIGFGIMILVNSIIDGLLKKRTYLYHKTMLLPVIINASLFGVNYYFLSLADKLNSRFEMISSVYVKDYNALLYGVAIYLILDYIIHIIKIKNSTVEFERKLDDNFKAVELLVFIVSVISMGIYVLYYALTVAYNNIGIYSTLKDIVKMPILGIVLLIMTVLLMVVNLTKKES